MELVLASQSPRRREVLTLMGIPYTADVCTEPEAADLGCSAAEMVQRLAYDKAKNVLQRHPNACVLGSDTVVLLHGAILGKPHSPDEAKAYLRRMQGQSHDVYTGVALLKADYTDIRCEVTHVTFRPMSEREIDWYVGTGEPLDKAGAYGVQGLGAVFVERIEGNYFNVIGLPAPTVYDMLKRAKMLKEDRT